MSISSARKITEKGYPWVGVFAQANLLASIATKGSALGVAICLAVIVISVVAIACGDRYKDANQ